MSVDLEIFAIFQHKVQRIPHFARVTEVRHIFTGTWYIVATSDFGQLGFRSSVSLNVRGVLCEERKSILYKNLIFFYWRENLITMAAL